MAGTNWTCCLATPRTTTASSVNSWRRFRHQRILVPLTGLNFVSDTKRSRGEILRTNRENYVKNHVKKDICDFTMYQYPLLHVVRMRIPSTDYRDESWTLLHVHIGCVFSRQISETNSGFVKGVVLGKYFVRYFILASFPGWVMSEATNKKKFFPIAC